MPPAAPITAGSVAGELESPSELKPSPSPCVGDQHLEEQEGRGEEKGQCNDSVQEEEREGWDACC